MGHLGEMGLDKRFVLISLVQGPAFDQLTTWIPFLLKIGLREQFKTRSSWLNCALRDDEAVYWVSIGHYEAVAVGN